MDAADWWVGFVAVGAQPLFAQWVWPMTNPFLFCRCSYVQHFVSKGKPVLRHGFDLGTALAGSGLHPHTFESSPDTTQDGRSRLKVLYLLFPPAEIPGALIKAGECPGPHCAWSNHAVRLVSMVLPSTLEACEHFPLLVLTLQRVHKLQFVFSISKILCQF